MLHLQCHIGVDTLSWARKGAKVTGVDYSAAALEVARNLALETGIDAEFVLSDVLDLPNHLKGTYDVVFTSYGVLCWSPDLKRWAEVVAHFLAPGGVFYIVEDHPLAQLIDEYKGPEVVLTYPYFTSGEPTRFEVKGSYVDRKAKVRQHHDLRVDSYRQRRGERRHRRGPAPRVLPRFPSSVSTRGIRTWSGAMMASGASRMRTRPRCSCL